MNKCIVAGSRDFNNYRLLKIKLDQIFSNIIIDVIISGTARGADKLGEKYAIEKGIHLIQCPANWEYYGKPAGIIRNKFMANIATHCVCFWDGSSPGTKAMIDIAKKNDLSLRVIKHTSDQ